ncbi:MAG: DNA-directed RNA polymerase subunit alpha [Armatimonadetes bacterium]|nr:DNA-directed RNA polymerase subunit alpha [Armatimonadota bacterium]MBS1710762.1 DNA-directed RNA polymerase subunit alpha [Armatimonadota bacterium]MBX3108433.1 DNA-directed RNA polymerase subunit alpha [Fimbriimonadaceae bacterium]
MPHIQTLDIERDYAKFVLEPLERGYGQTIGNALRRVLLSSIAGAAVTAVRIEKVFHEFAEIPGLKEDATEFLLNLKDLAIRVDPDMAIPEEIILKIDVKGPGRVTGADIECPEGVSIVNPECYLATISDKGATLTAELYASWGTGYVLPEKQEKYKGMIGILTTGSQFTPVKKVNYTVEATRVGQRTDYERMVLEVWTNGALGPNDAVTQSAQILDRYFRMFFDLGRASIEDIMDEGSASEEEVSNVPDIKIEELDFSQRTFNCLRRAGILNLRQLALVTEMDLNGIRGFGRKSLTEVRDRLAEHGIDLKPSKGGYINLDALEDDDF